MQKIKAFFKRIGQWFSNVFHASKIAAAFDQAIEELQTLRQALMDIADEKDDLEAQIAKYKKQIKDLKAKIKKQDTEE